MAFYQVEEVPCPTCLGQILRILATLSRVAANAKASAAGAATRPRNHNLLAHPRTEAGAQASAKPPVVSVAAALAAATKHSCLSGCLSTLFKSEFK